ncbi:MAG TPA: ferritin-like domain-containing protein [Aestuariivirgaceae bacterium]|nr:ferritin-like domain-containing protein [Aestuariivirgaceae bacterium]
MSETATSIFATCLRHAHAMETHALELLDRQAGRLGNYPEVQAQIHQHLAETERQLQWLAKCLDALGEDRLTVDDAAPSGLENILAISRALVGEEILKNTFANYAFEHYEIAAYKSLLTLCEMAIQRSIAPLLRESLAEEEAMAQWLGDKISRVTKDYVSEHERKARINPPRQMKESPGN